MPSPYGKKPNVATISRSVRSANVLTGYAANEPGYHGFAWFDLCKPRVRNCVGGPGAEEEEDGGQDVSARTHSRSSGAMPGVPARSLAPIRIV